MHKQTTAILGRYFSKACSIQLIRIFAIAAVLVSIAARATSKDQDNSANLREQQIARLRSFSLQKEKQSHDLAAESKEVISPELRTFFEAATKGDWRNVTNMFADFKKRHYQYDGSSRDKRLEVSYWSPVLEVSLAYDCIANCEPKYTQMAVDDIMKSIPAGAIYFGGSDPGRGLITAFCKSHAAADPFFTLTQKALTDGHYLQYLRSTYGDKIYVPTDEDSVQCFGDYVSDATKRLDHDTKHPDEPKQLKQFEDVRLAGGRIEVRGDVAVMEINARFVRLIFDKNPNHEFYIEDDRPPLDWTYPYLEPHGMIMKINRQPLPELPADILRKDHEYWRERVGGMLGNWLDYETPTSEVAAFAEKVFVLHDLGAFEGDASFVQNSYASIMFSQCRSAIARIYEWRLMHSQSMLEKQRLIKEWDLALAQAFAMCPYSMDAIFGYVQFLVNQNRQDDALLVAETGLKMPALRGNNKDQVQGLVDRLKKTIQAK